MAEVLNLITNHTCTVCKQKLPISDFHKAGKGTNGLYSQCKMCIKKQRSSVRGKIKQRNLNKLRITRSRQWLANFKNSLKCARCPESDSRCLDFHHIDPTTKEFTVSQMIHGGHSPKSILREIEKCIVLCANCHRKEDHNV